VKFVNPPTMITLMSGNQGIHPKWIADITHRVATTDEFPEFEIDTWKYLPSTLAAQGA
jgi:hypothetical protein